MHQVSPLGRAIFGQSIVNADNQRKTNSPHSKMLMVPQKAGFWGRCSPGRPWLVHAYTYFLDPDRNSSSIWLRSGLHAKDPQPCVARGCSTQEKVPDTQPCYSGSERTGRPDRVLDVPRAAPTTLKPVLYKVPIARLVEGGPSPGDNRLGCGLELPPIFFSLDELFGGPVVQQSAPPSPSVTVVVTYSYGPSARLVGI
jgi:hypothetical protein